MKAPPELHADTPPAAIVALLYDFSRTAVATDHVDEEYVAKPRTWDIGDQSNPSLPLTQWLKSRLIGKFGLS